MNRPKFLPQRTHGQGGKTDEGARYVHILRKVTQEVHTGCQGKTEGAPKPDWGSLWLSVTGKAAKRAS